MFIISLFLDKDFKQQAKGFLPISQPNTQCRDIEDLKKNHKPNKEKKRFQSIMQLNLFKNYRQKHRIYARLQTDIKAGRIEKQPCYVTGKVDVEAHHFNYMNPEDIIWLSRKIHKKLHSKIKEFEKAGIPVSRKMIKATLTRWRDEYLELYGN